jgi:hypothetical protein
LAAFILSLLSACTSTNNATGMKNKGKSYNNLFVIANTADIEVRVLLEKEAAAVAESKGYQVVKSIDVIAPSLSDTKPPTKTELFDKVKTSGCQVLLMVYFIKKDAGVEYIPGTKFEGGNLLLTGLVAGIAGYKGTVDNTKYNKSISIPGSFEKVKGFYLLSELLDTETEEIIYTEKSELFEEDHLLSFSKVYITDLVKQLETNKILLK